jgi:hypothetical protein
VKLAGNARQLPALFFWQKFGTLRATLMKAEFVEGDFEDLEVRYELLDESGPEKLRTQLPRKIASQNAEIASDFLMKRERSRIPDGRQRLGSPTTNVPRPHPKPRKSTTPKHLPVQQLYSFLDYFISTIYQVPSKRPSRGVLQVI